MYVCVYATTLRKLQFVKVRLLYSMYSTHAAHGANVILILVPKCIITTGW